MRVPTKKTIWIYKISHFAKFRDHDLAFYGQGTYFYIHVYNFLKKWLFSKITAASRAQWRVIVLYETKIIASISKREKDFSENTKGTFYCFNNEPLCIRCVFVLNQYPFIMTLTSSKTVQIFPHVTHSTCTRVYYILLLRYTPDQGSEAFL